MAGQTGKTVDRQTDRLKAFRREKEEEKGMQKNDLESKRLNFNQIDRILPLTYTPKPQE